MKNQAAEQSAEGAKAATRSGVDDSAQATRPGPGKSRAKASAHQNRETRKRAGRAGLPDRVTAHPGEVLREEFLKPLGISITELAQALRLPSRRIVAVIRGDCGINADTALRLGRYFGTTPEFWFGLQAMHDLTRVHLQIRAVIEREIRPRNAAGN